MASRKRLLANAATGAPKEGKGAVQNAPAMALAQPPQPDTPSNGILGASFTEGKMRMWNRWRERFNPLRGLTVAWCVTLLEMYQRGEMADPTWAYYFVEQSDPDLFAIIERREAALIQLDWNTKPICERWSGEDARHEGFDSVLAGEQVSCLRESYEGVDNLYESFAHFQMATFRGFAHCEKWRNGDGDIYHLEVVDQWNMVRDLLRGRWKYNPDAISTTFYAISDDMLIDPANFMIRERDRHVDRIGLLKFIRNSLGEKDWDAFMEIYGIPGGVVIGPNGVPPEKENEFRAAAQGIADGGSGYLPYGSIYTPNELQRGTDPFRPRLDYLTEKLVLAGTGGLLTMLTQSGSGTLAGSAHQEAFDTIARGEARTISALFQKQFDAEILERHFPGQPALAYFELAANEEQDPAAIGALVQQLSSGSYEIDPGELSEKLGFTITLRADPAGNSSNDDEAVEDDDADIPDDADLTPVANRIAELRALPDEELPLALAQFAANELPLLCNRLAGDRGPALARKLALRLLSNSNPNHDPANGRFSSCGSGGSYSGVYQSAEHEAQQIANGRAAMERVIASQADHLDAMHRPGVGNIDFRWGNSGGGVRHILEKREREGRQHALAGQTGREIAMKMPEVIANGKLGAPYADRNGRKRSIDHGGYRAVLSLDHGEKGKKQRRAWLLTGFQKL
jgi:hypothetical protein